VVTGGPAGWGGCGLGLGLGFFGVGFGFGRGTIRSGPKGLDRILLRTATTRPLRAAAGTTTTNPNRLRARTAAGEVREMWA